MPSKLENLVALPAHEFTPREPDNAGISDALLVGEVIESAGPRLRGQARIRWQTPDGSWNERPLSYLNGIVLQKGDRVLLRRPANWPEWLVTNVIAPRNAPGSVLLQGKDELVLRCGEASLTLRRNGRVVLRGTYVESRSKGTNRIKGGSVQIN
jgi:hypothetical protein